ncbi:MAG: tetratricopeptide repeat protein [Cyclobacteriaceae bacterium]
MPSLISGYEYDIFISYRQKDNKYDGWVSEFVANLRKEMEGIMKDDISIYFDENPDDGLLESHNVDKSLEGKLNALIFIPIISQTYCDPKSFAWQHEFLSFCDRAKADNFGLNIKLANGNVSSRILPVRIHNLDPADQSLFERESGGVLRCIDFIFRSPGVNRPLRSMEEHSRDNLNKTFYRDQLNKVANAIKEITVGLKNNGTVIHPGHDHFLQGTRDSEKSIAVLPFVNMSNDPEQEYFSDGISEEIINMLVQLPDLKVAGRTSAFSFKNKNKDLRSIAEKLNVNNILEGSVRKSGNRIRITAQLIEASTGFHLWSQKFDRELNDVFRIQDEIAKAIVDQLQVSLSGKPVEPKERIQTQNVEAYQLYLKGMAFFYKRGLDMFEGLRCFEAALKLDPDYALALVGIADTYTMLSFHSYLAPEEAWPKALAAANKALELGPDMAEAHCAIATIALLCERNWKKAESGYKRALELNPRYLQARSWYSLFYLGCVRADHSEALKHARLSVENDPMSAYAYVILCIVSSMATRYDESIEAASKAVEYDPDAFTSWHWLGNSYHWSGNLQAAIKPFNRALEISGRHNWTLTSLVVIYAEDNHLREANVIYNELLTKAKLSFVSPALLAIASAALDKNEDALRYARQAYERRDPFQVVTSNSWPDSKKLRSLPEYREILKLLAFDTHSEINDNNQAE